MPTITAGGWTFAYQEAGSGPPLFLLHGLLMDRTMWDEQVAALAGRYRVVTVDAPGQGSSPPRAAGFTLEDEAAALWTLAGEIGVDGPAVWGGHSMGGMKSMRIALDHPVRALILIDTQPYPENPDARAQYDALFQVLAENGPNDDLAALTGMTMFGAAYVSSAEGQRWIKGWSTLHAPQIEGSWRSVMDRGDISARIGEISVPTLVVHGTDDTPIAVEVARDYVTKIPNATLVEIAGSGHTSPCEKPVEVTKAIEDFLARI